MKKLLAILLSLLLTLTCVSAMAEATAPTTVRFVEDSPNFDIEMPLPEGATVGEMTGAEMVSIVEVLNGNLAPVSVAIAASDIYETQSMNDLTDEEIEALKLIASEQYENPEVTVDVTPSGNKYIHICANSEFDVDSIFTLYMGYFVELTQWHDDYESLGEDDYAFMLQLLYNIEFLPLQ